MHDLEEDPDPDLESDRFMNTPEHKFIIEFMADGAEYIAVCLPAFSPDTVHRDDA